MELVLATHNVHKIREFRKMLVDLSGMDISSLLQYPKCRLPEETGNSFEENARIKALHAAKELGKLVLADDSGLVVPALNGAPGIFSARYAGKDAADQENCTKLLQQMHSFEDIRRAAYFQCSLCLATPEGIVKEVTGFCEGMILEKEKGNGGFGYDPLFIKHDYDKTFAELSEETKNRISHRRKALEKLHSTLESLLRRQNLCGA